MVPTSRIHRAGLGLAFALAAAAGLSAPAVAQGFDLPEHFEAVALPGQYTFPVAFDFTPDGVIFVAEKPGTVRVVAPDGLVQAQRFVDLTAEVNNHHERGLLGIAVHPRFVPDSGPRSWVYLLYTVSPVPGSDVAYSFNDQYSFSRLTRYRAATTPQGIVAVPGSRQVLLGNQLADGSVPDCIASLHESHSNGSLRFADDGTLIVSTGDGAHFDLSDFGGNDPEAFDTFIHPQTNLKGPVPKVQDEGSFRSQDRRSLAGKLLRIDPETGQGYPSNPFWDGNAASNASRIWALGLRNPFRISLIPGTGALDPAAGRPNLIVAADVGLSDWDEFDLARNGGENFGWPCLEALTIKSDFFNYHPGLSGKVTCHTPPTGVGTAPLLTWHHTDINAVTPPGLCFGSDGLPVPGFTGNCVIGGDFYRGGGYPPEYVGRMFFADFGEGYLKTLEFGAQWTLTAVHDFATNVGPLTELRAHPLTGDIHALSMNTGQILRLSYGANLTPVAVAAGAPTLGSAPLVVQFTGSDSHDPDQDALSFDWDFGDGTPHASVPDPQHAYAANGVYTATLTVTDTLGLAGSAAVPVAVGNGPPVATIVNPLPATLYQPPTTLALVGQGSDPENGALTYSWKVDQYHGVVVIPGAQLARGPVASLDISSSAAEGEVVYYRIELTVTDAGGLSGSDHAWVYPLTTLRDVSGTAHPISRLDTLAPPFPVGGGNPDVEVIRDLVFPAVGSGDDLAQYDSNHLGAQGNDDWIGYELVEAPGAELRFVGLTFQEGGHYVHGGWWEDLRVEVRDGEEWSVVPELTIDPPYPFELAEQPFFDGLGYQTYTLRFEPVHGDAIRLRGTPGGTTGFISVAELRLLALSALPPSDQHEISGQGAIIARLFELDPPVSLAPFTPGVETIRNGTWPILGSQSYIAQFNTFHAGDQAGFDWIGYEYATPRTFSRIVYQEGRNTTSGGAFETLSAEVRKLDGTWVPIAGLNVTPPYPGLNELNYETFTLDFPPVLARAIRVSGPPAGHDAFITIGELAVYEPQLPQGCGTSVYGPATGANTLALWSNTPPSPGLPIALGASGAAGPALGYLLLSFAPAAMPTHGGTLLVSPTGMSIFVVGFNGNGDFAASTWLPANPVLQGLSLHLQLVAFGQPPPHPFRFSNGLELTLCFW